MEWAEQEKKAKATQTKNKNRNEIIDVRKSAMNIGGWRRLCLARGDAK